MTDTLALHTRPIRRRFRRGFRRAVEDSAVSMSLDMGSRSRTLLIAFGGMQGQIGMPPFEFFRATGGIPVKRLFVRDLRQAWYHRGIPGGGSTIPDVAESLEQVVAQHEVDRIVTAGNSSGGYAALLFGTLLGADDVLCFAPQTVLELDILAGMDDHRWDDQLRGLVEAGGLDARWTDLRQVLPRIRREETGYEVYFDHSYDPDRLHAERVSELKGVRLRPVDGGAHGIARQMRETGELERVLRDVLATPQARPT
jgi:pimeloyl-ACP methyl ester carboxylesterase